MEKTSHPGIKLSFLANAVAAVIAKGLTATEENVLGNFIILIGTALTTMAAIDEGPTGGTSGGKPTTNCRS